MNTIKPIIFILSVLTATLGLCAAANDTDETPDVQARTAKFREIFERLHPVRIYGKVTDQEGRPVANADVMLRWETAEFLIGKQKSSPQTEWLKSYEDGTWTFKIDKPHRAFVAEVKIAGYALVARDSYGSAGGNLVEHKTTPDNPVVSVLRKKGETTFLLKESSLHFQVLASESGKTIGYDFVQREPIRNVANPRGDDATHYDLTVAATFNTNEATWTAVLSTGNTNGGIVLSEQLLYEAPENGYQPEYSFTPEGRKPVKAKYVYLKSRGPAIYTRLEIEYINANKDFFRLSGKSVTNPYGERNLEQATDLPYEVTKQLADEAKTAFRQNKRPEKPDVPKLVKEAKEKAENGSSGAPRKR